MKRKSMSQVEPKQKIRRENSDKPSNLSIGHFFHNITKGFENNIITQKCQNIKTIEEEVKAKRIQAEQAVLNRNLFEQPKKNNVPKAIIKENFSTIIFPLFIKCQLGGMKEKINSDTLYTQVKQTLKQYNANDCIYLEYLNKTIG
jgi:hypothetical protein